MEPSRRAGLAQPPAAADLPALRTEPAPPPPRHEVTVVHRGSFAVATCADCGWNGRARRAVANAVEDADLHRNLGAGL